jgi:hypothetical protein
VIQRIKGKSQFIQLRNDFNNNYSVEIPEENRIKFEGTL